MSQQWRHPERKTAQAKSRLSGLRIIQLLADVPFSVQGLLARGFVLLFASAAIDEGSSAKDA
jgi:hypothetical protein